MNDREEDENRFITRMEFEGRIEKALELYASITKFNDYCCRRNPQKLGAAYVKIAVPALNNIGQHAQMELDRDRYLDVPDRVFDAMQVICDWCGDLARHLGFPDVAPPIDDAIAKKIKDPTIRRIVLSGQCPPHYYIKFLKKNPYPDQRTPEDDESPPPKQGAFHAVPFFAKPIRLFETMTRFDEIPHSYLKRFREAFIVLLQWQVDEDWDRWTEGKQLGGDES